MLDDISVIPLNFKTLQEFQKDPTRFIGKAVSLNPFADDLEGIHQEDINLELVKEKTSVTREQIDKQAVISLLNQAAKTADLKTFEIDKSNLQNYSNELLEKIKKDTIFIIS